jgi:hypothetical protein
MDKKKRNFISCHCSIAASKIKESRIMKPGTSGMYGPGIYFAATPEICKRKALRTGFLVTCKVRLGISLGVMTYESSICPSLNYNTVRYQYSCNSTTGLVGGGVSNEEYVVYRSEDAKVISVQDLTQLNDNSIRTQFFNNQVSSLNKFYKKPYKKNTYGSSSSQGLGLQKYGGNYKPKNKGRNYRSPPVPPLSSPRYGGSSSNYKAKNQGYNYRDLPPRRSSPKYDRYSKNPRKNYNYNYPPRQGPSKNSGISFNSQPYSPNYNYSNSSGVGGSNQHYGNSYNSRSKHSRSSIYNRAQYDKKYLALQNLLENIPPQNHRFYSFGQNNQQNIERNGCYGKGLYFSTRPEKSDLQGATLMVYEVNLANTKTASFYDNRSKYYDSLAYQDENKDQVIFIPTENATCVRCVALYESGDFSQILLEEEKYFERNPEDRFASIYIQNLKDQIYGWDCEAFIDEDLEIAAKNDSESEELNDGRIGEEFDRWNQRDLREEQYNQYPYY